MEPSHDSSPGPLGVSPRVWTILLAVSLGFAVVGLLVGTRPARRPGRASVGDAATPPAAAARTYTELREARALAGAAPEVAALAGSARQTALPGAPTPAEKRAALAARAKRRAFDGAPPVVPHGIDQRSSEACLACHGQGVVVDGKTAPPVSHPRYASCTQCHVEATNSFAKPPEPVATSFVGWRRSGRGQRASAGAPPIIPHPTHMRESCLACHGPAGKPGLRTSHPQRTSCRQCHAAAGDRYPFGPTK